MTREARSKHSILLVDDEPEILQSLMGLLRREFDLHTATSGKEALEILQENTIHVIMTDQRMPEMTGVQLMRRVANEHPEAIRIVFTGYADIKAVIDAINNGGLYRYITKPWDPDELIALLHEAADRYDEIVGRDQLLLDVLKYVQQGQRIVDDLRGLDGDGHVERNQLDAFAEDSSQLAQRLNRLV